MAKDTIGSSSDEPEGSVEGQMKKLQAQLHEIDARLAREREILKATVGLALYGVPGAMPERSLEERHRDLAERLEAALAKRRARK